MCWQKTIRLGPPQSPYGHQTLSNICAQFAMCHKLPNLCMCYLRSLYNVFAEHRLPWSPTPVSVQVLGTLSTPVMVCYAP